MEISSEVAMTRARADKPPVFLPLGKLNLPCILALDPGTTTGYAVHIPESGEVVCGQLGPQPHNLRLLSLIENENLPPDRPLTVVYEQFEFRQNESRMRSELRSYVNTLRKGEIRSLSAIIARLEQITDSWGGRDGLVLDARDYIGVVKLAAQRDPSITLASQSASEGKRFVGDNKLRALGWYKPTAGMPHGRDALRHLLRYLVVVRRVREPITTTWCGEGGSAATG